jgi:hypothetical protein
VWTDRIGTWWPPDHTATGQADLIVLEGGVGAADENKAAAPGTVEAWDWPQRLTACGRGDRRP